MRHEEPIMASSYSDTKVHSKASLVDDPRFRPYRAAQLDAIVDANARLQRFKIQAVLMVTPDGRIVSYVYGDVRTKVGRRHAHKMAWNCYGGPAHFSADVFRPTH
jgi:hypothetical protein